MDDATKAAVGRVRSVLAQESFDEGDFEGTDLAAILAHVDGEPARIAAARSVEAQESDGYARGVAAERARVVVWLRATMAEPGWCDETVGVLTLLVLNFERGEHEKEGA